MEKIEVYKIVLEEVKKLGISSMYLRTFLASMVLRKGRHPEEGILEISQKVSKTVVYRFGKKDVTDIDPEEQKMREATMDAFGRTPATYGKNNIVETSCDKSLDRLAEALYEATNIPEEWLPGLKAGRVVKELAKIVWERLEEEADDELDC